MSYIVENYKKVLEEIHSSKSTPSPILIAVSKKQTLESIREAIQGGITIFGENKIQEGIEKFSKLKDEGFDFELHHIGPLQTGNLRKLFGLFSYTHGVTSESSLKELLKEALKRKQPIRYFLEANLTDESSKSGFNRNALVETLKKISTFQNEYCIFEGLMTMGPTNEDPTITRNVFKDLNSIRKDFCPDSKCSMGMSGDYKIAIEEGSNFVRIGTLIFGKRSY
ncbi:MAG: YggS family pyridoxal phosphate-dependent enzyme [Leptospiraceae bacterium]|nr:YggS family pyridoxal phosphate-dependent enzyme [Leptospiraceae bacterium]MCK6382469.1 YggS family pyridoxal phosphate-dependent enzyme [Leptospiraceae bacterium]NUM40934.1 YggS family pyridoxal phosphate-dependent enzyme [Leptospiraceae bacterium]